MKFSAQEEFGLRCMVAIAREGESGFLTIPAVAKSEGLTQSHVAKLLAVLRKGGFVNSHRGQQGGYTLSRPANEMLVGDLLSVLGGRLTHEDFCVRFTGQKDRCVHTDDCSLLPLWRLIQKSVDSAIAGMTLADLVECEPGPNVRVFKDPSERRLTGV